MTYRSVTLFVSVSATRQLFMCPKLRRITTPTARNRPTAMMRAQPVTTVEVATSPSSNRGTITSSMTHRMTTLEATVQIANNEAPATEVANSLGCSPKT